MKPEIYEETRVGKRHAFLVDSDTAFLAPHKGVTSRHYAAAIELGELESGHLREFIDPETGVRTIFGPTCCLMAVRVFKDRPKPTGNPVESRGFDPQAAAVLLDLAAACNNLRPAYGVKRWEFCPPADGFAQPWDELKFLAAWRWSYWKRERLTGAQRHSDMQKLGYAGTADALRQMLKRMGLVRPKKSKPERSLYSL